MLNTLCYYSISRIQNMYERLPIHIHGISITMTNVNILSGNEPKTNNIVLHVTYNILHIVFYQTMHMAILVHTSYIAQFVILYFNLPYLTSEIVRWFFKSTLGLSFCINVVFIPPNSVDSYTHTTYNVFHVKFYQYGLNNQHLFFPRITQYMTYYQPTIRSTLGALSLLI